MEKHLGKFILFDADSFGAWLMATDVHRIIRLIQQHHTWCPSYSNFRGDNHFKLLKGMEAAHLANGWCDIAQNLTIFPDGTVAVCRPLDQIPAGIKGANTGGICIENIGCFDVGHDLMADVHAAAVIKVTALLCRRFSLAPSTESIVYHHWYDLVSGKRTNGSGNVKTCPGDRFFGGNRVAAAAANFVPKVAAELARVGGVPAPPAVTVLFAGRVVSDDALNVRDQAAAVGHCIKALPKGTIVNAYESVGTWCRIDPTKSLWVNSRFLERVAA